MSSRCPQVSRDCTGPVLIPGDQRRRRGKTIRYDVLYGESAAGHSIELCNAIAAYKSQGKFQRNFQNVLRTFDAKYIQNPIVCVFPFKDKR